MPTGVAPVAAIRRGSLKEIWQLGGENIVMYILQCALDGL